MFTLRIPTSCSLYIILLLRSINLVLGDIDYTNSRVWGPGLDTSSQMPTQYVFVELYNVDGTRLAQSQGDLQVRLSSDGKVFRGRSQVIDRNDGSYIINFRPATALKDVTLVIQHNGKHLAKSPYKIAGWMYQENCDCPSTNTQDWLDALQCPLSYDQLDEDLKPFPHIDMRKVEEQVGENWPKRPGQGALMHYIVKDNKVYRKEIGSICGFKMFVDSILLSLARKVKLPDVEFFINLGDWPLVKKTGGTTAIPVFGWCGSDSTADIILPTYDVTDSTMKSLSQVSLDILTVQGPPNTPVWSDKKPKALFRGRDSRQERLNVAKLSKRQNNSELLDAGITAFFFFPKDESIMADRIGFFDFFKYKYQLNIDGTVAAYRFPYLMLGDSLVFKQRSSYYEHFYRHLKPWTHYIPVKSDLSDVLEQIIWAREHDEQAKHIADTGRAKVREMLTPASIYCYHYRALQKFAELLTSKVEVQPDMELATHPDYMSSCNCQRTKHKAVDGHYVTDEL